MWLWPRADVQGVRAEHYRHWESALTRSVAVNVTRLMHVLHLTTCFGLQPFACKKRLEGLSLSWNMCMGRGSLVGIATAYGLDGPGIESQWGRNFSAPVQTGLEAHLASCTVGTGFFPGVRCGRGVTLTPHPHSSAEVKNRVELYLYSPWGPSWPLKGWNMCNF